MNIPAHPPELAERVLDLALQIQQIPAPTFSEHARAAFILKRFKKEGLKRVALDEVGNVYAQLTGKGAARPVVVSAHIDTIFPPDTNLSITRSAERIHAPGLGDNSIGVAALFGLVWALEHEKTVLPGDLWLVANVAEEGLGNLLGMHAVVGRFGPEPLAYIVLEGMSLGRVYHRGLGVQRFRITAETPGGHSWSDFGQPSAIHELAELITQLASIPLSRDPRTTLNVGTVNGGFSINTIAPSAGMELDLRSEDLRALEALVAQVQQLVASAARSGVEIQIEPIGARPTGALPPDHDLVAMAADVLRSLGEEPQLSVGSTDANVPLSRGYPAMCIGITTGGGAHSTAEYIDIPPLVKGLAQLHAVVSQAFERLED
ncbi:MAG: M20/M25/M40 family metallo-hydrolase [Anaerolineae bacterium]|nr:M20/M25/M40 family metallo-hydrolase [Anaerolineae bacterium]